ncbi:RagB/SusD family nutrient uptake outer membrane protein [Fulvivirgaceae bacterium BMA10]|uniref:RagB/SusD family nutrient uptake outer membrane protein n=1 Tax=Splendidivirga corallicola TaxID=3051826 RepID=A0ABT8KTZ2_9BACT|nr:RagB/SusD family nutrient uptake outer membrane protein [Fulvivirgaceae bacterium BMA10]
MKFLNKIILIAILGVFASCEKDLDLAPLDTISDGSFWKVAADFEKAANAFYHGLGNHSNGGKDQDSDITVGNISNSVSNGTLIAPQNSNFWNGSYGTIRGTTRLTENYETASEDLKTEVARFAAEARFFRARAYFGLVSTYGDVPLVKRVLDVDSEELDAPRASRADVVAYIFEDLDWAIANLPKESELAASEKGRVTHGAALALKSRVGLFEGTWAKYHGSGDANSYLTASIEAARQLMATNEYGIYTHPDGPGASYYNLFIEAGQGSEESILARRYNDELNIFHNTTRWVETHHNSPTKKLADMYLCTDGLPIDQSPLFQGYDMRNSEFQDRDPRMRQTIIEPGSTVTWNEGPRIYDVIIGSGNNGPTKSGYLAYKFQSGSASAAQGRSLYHYMELRYGEVLLNLAEALFEKDGMISDGDLDATINLLRDRAGMPSLTNGFVSANAMDMLTEIRRERTIELAYEGFRLNDLRRWKTAETELPNAILGVKFVGTEYATVPPNDALVVGVDLQVDASGFIIADDASNRSFDPAKNYLFALPLDQIQLNPNLTQNPNW